MMTRILSALVAAVLIIGVAVFFKTTGLYVICSLAIAGCIFEYSRLTLAKGKSPLHFQIAFMIAAALVYVSVVLSSPYTLSAAVLSAVILAAMGVVGVRRSNDLGHAFKLISAAILGLLYVGFFPGYAIALLGLENGIVYFFGLLVIVFFGDSFAYFVGRFFGKTKLLEAVSPKKTVAGSVGGLFGSALAGFLLAFYFLGTTSLFHLVIIAVVSGAFGQIGDLFESLIKRLADVKDSGRIMPGHGGFLDRLDGVLFAAPVFYILLQFLT